LGREDDDRIITEQSEGYTDQDINEHYQVVAQRRIDQAAWVDDEEELENCFSSVGRLNQVVPFVGGSSVSVEPGVNNIYEDDYRMSTISAFDKQSLTSYSASLGSCALDIKEEEVDMDMGTVRQIVYPPRFESNPTSRDVDVRRDKSVSATMETIRQSSHVR
jgi:hypothetical protein